MDVTDPANPTVLGTFGGDQLAQGGYNVCRVSGSLLLVASQNEINTGYFTLLIYSVADPLRPTLVSSTQIDYHFIADMVVRGTTAYFPLNGISTFVNVILTDQFGDFLAVDFSDPAQPRLSDVLFDNRGPADGGDYQENGEAVVDGGLTYVATTTSKGGDSQNGSGELLLVDTSDPAHLAVAGTLLIPDTVQLVNVVIDGDRALAIGSTGGSSISSGAASAKLAGNLTLTPLDISDPLHPRIIGPTVVTQDQFFDLGDNEDGGKVDAIALGNGTFAISDTQLGGKPVILLVDASDPDGLVFGTIQTSSPVNGMTASGGLLYATSQDGLSVYRIGLIIGDPVTASVRVPNSGVVTYDPASFDVPPSEIVHGPQFDTLTWFTSLGAGTTQITYTWNSILAPFQPSGIYASTLGGSVDFTSGGEAGAIPLPPTSFVLPRDNILTVTPFNQTVRPGSTASFTVSLYNDLFVPYTFQLSVAGLPAGWVDLPAAVTIPPRQGMDVPLTVVTGADAPVGDYGFTVVATSGVESDSQQVGLTLAGQPVPPVIDPDSHGVVVALTPARVSAGQGSAGMYAVRLTNTGSADESFMLSAAGLPPGVTAAFGQSVIDVPPGVGNFRDVSLTLTPGRGTAVGPLTFSVTATSTTHPTNVGGAAVTLDVRPYGVAVGLSKTTGAPGSTFYLTVTNTGEITDTFDLTLGGPAALVSRLAQNRVTLAAGASATVAISTGAADFVVQGPLTLVAFARSERDPAVGASTTSALTVPATKGMTARFSPATQIIQVPGTSDFLLLVTNTGNTEDAYTAYIAGIDGPVTARLVGLDGLPTQTIPTFRIPGLSTAAILIHTTSTSFGVGRVHILIRSLSDGDIVASVTAVMVTSASVPSTPPDGTVPETDTPQAGGVAGGATLIASQLAGTARLGLEIGFGAVAESATDEALALLPELLAFPGGTTFTLLPYPEGSTGHLATEPDAFWPWLEDLQPAGDVIDPGHRAAGLVGTAEGVRPASSIMSPPSDEQESDAAMRAHAHDLLFTALAEDFVRGETARTIATTRIRSEPARRTGAGIASGWPLAGAMFGAFALASRPRSDVRRRPQSKGDCPRRRSGKWGGPI